MTTTTKTQTIAFLNDRARRGIGAHRLNVTPGVQALQPLSQACLLTLVRGFSAFTPDNDPHGEHDFGAVTVEGQKCFWKIDYYDRSLEYGSDDPSDPNATVRVITLMLASEY